MADSTVSPHFSPSRGPHTWSKAPRAASYTGHPHSGSPWHRPLSWTTWGHEAVLHHSSYVGEGMFSQGKQSGSFQIVPHSISTSILLYDNANCNFFLLLLERIVVISLLLIFFFLYQLFSYGVIVTWMAKTTTWIFWVQSQYTSWKDSLKNLKSIIINYCPIL